ncbi:MAG: fructose-bisphosphate aldolase [Propionicimonas sp.]
MPSSTLDALLRTGSGRCLITAFDHGSTSRPPAGARPPLQILADIVAGQPDGVLLSPGMLRAGRAHLTGQHAPAAVLRTDWTVVEPEWIERFGEHYRVLIEPEQARDLGADAICIFLISGPARGAQFADNVRTVAQTCARAQRLGLPVIVEATLWGALHGAARRDPENLAHVCRMAFELGADAIKTEYTGDPVTMREVIGTVAVPVLTLGGSRLPFEQVAEAARGALTAGAHGLVFGRNIWQSPDPAATTRALRGIVNPAS